MVDKPRAAAYRRSVGLPPLGHACVVALGAALVVPADQLHGSAPATAAVRNPIEQRQSLTLDESGSIGSFSVFSGTLAEAKRTFGAPTETLRNTDIRACKVTWRPLGLYDGALRGRRRPVRATCAALAGRHAR